MHNIGSHYYWIIPNKLITCVLKIPSQNNLFPMDCQPLGKGVKPITMTRKHRWREDFDICTVIGHTTPLGRECAHCSPSCPRSHQQILSTVPVLLTDPQTYFKMWTVWYSNAGGWRHSPTPQRILLCPSGARTCGSLSDSQNLGTF